MCPLFIQVLLVILGVSDIRPQNISVGSGIKLIQTQINIHNGMIIPCVIRFSSILFKSERALKGSLMILNLTPEKSLLERDLLRTLSSDSKHEWSIMVKDALLPHFNASHVTDKARNYFMMVTNSTEVDKVVHQWKMLPTWNPLAQVVVMITTFLDGEELMREIIVIMEKLLASYFLNVYVMSHKENSHRVFVYSWYPYNNSNCGEKVIGVRLVGECELFNINGKQEFDEIIHVNNIRMKIPKDLHKCSLHVESRQWEPYALFSVEKGFYLGIEIELVKEISRRMNMNPIFSKIDSKRMLSVNHSSLFTELVERSVDIMVGGMDEDSITRKFLSSSTPYYQDDLTWCVAKAGPFPQWMNVFATFDSLAWTTVILMFYLCNVILWYLIKLEKKWIKDIWWCQLEVLNMILGNSWQYEPTTTFSKIFIVSLAYFGINIAASYHSFLISVLTRPRYQTQIASIEEAIGFGMNLVGDRTTLNHFRKNDQVSQYVNRNFKVCDDINECLRKLKKNNNLAVAVSRMHALTNPAIHGSEIYCFKRNQNIYTFSVSMLTKRDFHLLPRMNALIRQVLEYGLLQKWDDESRGAKLNTYAEIEEEFVEGSDNQIVLTFSHVEGAFFVLGIGTAIAFLVFLLECTIQLQKRTGKCKQIAIFADQLLAPISNVTKKMENSEDRI